MNVYIVHAQKCRVYIPMHTWKLEKDIRCLVHQECRVGVDRNKENLLIPLLQGPLGEHGARWTANKPQPITVLGL